jgi:DNA-binding response OmpR family regulator
MKVLLLEDDMLLSEIITEYLDSLNYQVVSVFNGEEAEDIVYSETFDLLLLDVNVPKLNGFEFLKGVRSTGNKTPAIFITSLHESADLLEGFDAGCDDYIKKPFDLVELKARIDNIKRLFSIDEKTVYTISDTISYDAPNHTFIIDNKLYKLPKKEALIFEYLLHNKGKTISSNELISNLWSYEDAPTDATIRTYIRNLRQLLPKNSIETIKGVGYRFNS